MLSVAKTSQVVSSQGKAYWGQMLSLSLPLNNRKTHLFHRPMKMGSPQTFIVPHVLHIQAAWRLISGFCTHGEKRRIKQLGKDELSN